MTPGQKVTDSTGRPGIIKRHSSTKGRIYVVFNCGGFWDKYENYEAENVRIKDLKPGWIEDFAEKVK